MIIATMMVGVFSNLGIFNINEQSKYLKNSTIFTIFFKDNRSSEIEILNAFEPAVRTAVKKLNEMRKDAGFTMEDKIDVYWQTKNEYTKQAILEYTSQIMKDVLALDLYQERNAEVDIEKEVNGLLMLV